MSFGRLKIFLIFVLFVELLLALKQNVSTLNESEEVEGPSRVLSRRKRYLIFPDGSSFQLVFCTQNHGYLQIGDVVWFGQTAALAWELPTDPKLFYFFKEHEKGFAQNRDGVSKSIYFLDENGKVLSKVPYRKRPIVNPAFAKRSVDQLNIKRMHEKQKEVQHFASLDKNEIQFHREGRKNLYVQLEKFVKAVGWNGRECITRLLCETRRGGTKQGTFLEEIMRATFTLPPDEFESDLHKHYDEAHNFEGDCSKMYPDCEGMVEKSY